MKVIKRTGFEVDFDKSKIVKAIQSANNDVRSSQKASSQVISAIADNIEAEVQRSSSPLSVEDIQDMVETGLMSANCYTLARKYIRYRYERELARDKYNKIMTRVGEKLLGKNIKNQNANLDERSFGGRMGEAGDVASEEFAMTYLISPKVRENHLKNRVYIHDRNHYSLGDHNCLSLPIDDLLKNGFSTRQVNIRPAGSVATALQLVAVSFQCQSLVQFGGVSATHIDWSMEPYIRKSFYKHFKDGMKYILGCSYIPGSDNDDVTQILKCRGITNETPISDQLYKDFSSSVYEYAYDMTNKETYQAVEGLLHNLNSLQSRSGNQLPFSSINYGTCTSEEGRMLIKHILAVTERGLGPTNQTSIFPCQIFQVMEGVNKHKGDPNYDLFRKALKCTAQRLYPNYCNVDWSGNEGYDRNDPRTYFSTMGKRKLQLI